MCVDWTDEFFIYGNTEKPDYNNIEFLYVPCNYIHTSEADDAVSSECVSDLAKQKEYLGPLNLILFYNQEVFD